MTELSVEWFKEQKKLKRTNNDIAAELGTTRQSLQRRLRKLGLVQYEWASLCGRKRGIDYTEVVKMYKENISFEDIAEHFDVSVRTIFNIITKEVPKDERRPRCTTMPEYFTKEWLEEQAKLGKTNVQLMDELNVVSRTFYDWKKRVTK